MAEVRFVPNSSLLAKIEAERGELSIGSFARQIITDHFANPDKNAYTATVVEIPPDPENPAEGRKFRITLE